MSMSKETTDGDPMEPSSACYGIDGPPDDDESEPVAFDYDPACICVECVAYAGAVS